MTQVNTSTELAGATKLWRYISLDKLVDLLTTGELYFSPLASFAKTDPFEGFLPSVGLDAYASVFQKQVNNLEHAHQMAAEYRLKAGNPLTALEEEQLQASLDDLRSTPRRLIPAISKAITVSCWHANEGESEAMWRLYADNGKAVAIETTLDALKKAIQKRSSPHVVHAYPVKYLDFDDTTLQPKDCVVEGHLMPLIKRISYQHEHEVRAFITKVAPDPRTGADIAFWKPEPIRLPIDVETLIMGIHVSPYAEAPYRSSVASICDRFALKPGTVKLSQLLAGCDDLLDRLSI